MISTILGLMIATIGIDLQSGQPRYTMGVPELQDGVGFILAVVGLFAIAEVFFSMEEMTKGTRPEIIKLKGKLWLTKEEWKRSIMPIMRGGLVGFVIGVLPGAGGTIASIMSYVWEKRLSKHPEEFGHGAVEGVAGPEAANNADTAGALVPLLTLGIPGGGATAVMLGAFIMYGIQPGPLLFQNRPDLVWGLIDSMYIGNIMLLILNLPLIGMFVRLLYIPGRHPDAADPRDLHDRDLRHQRQPGGALFRAHIRRHGLHIPQGGHPGRADGAVPGARAASWSSRSGRR